ncbi:MAG TPA: NADH-quinone oxidoreductase subunit A [Verrucomicrobiota bacterium]|nr:NADH-quinone oxidoreductase subunit I [Verrucomicrobiales bacterium]HRI15044.1 NADH-quinone oxidoreductase subunit A [Verrucomicrobiota bacterium]
MRPDEQPYVFLAVFFAVALAFPLVPLILARLWARAFSPAKPGLEKNATYECGLATSGDPLVRFRSGYYLYGLLFLVFDVEIVFLFPFAVAFLNLPVGAVIAMLLFVLLLLEGLAWAWMKGLLTWS